MGPWQKHSKLSQALLQLAYPDAGFFARLHSVIPAEHSIRVKSKLLLRHLLAGGAAGLRAAGDRDTRGSALLCWTRADASRPVFAKRTRLVWAEFDPGTADTLKATIFPKRAGLMQVGHCLGLRHNFKGSMGVSRHLNCRI